MTAARLLSVATVASIRGAMRMLGRLGLIALLGLVSVARGAQPLPPLPGEDVGRVTISDDAFGGDDQAATPLVDAGYKPDSEFWLTSESPLIETSYRGDADLCCDDCCFDCDSCIGGCCDPCCRARFYVGLDFGVLKPEADSLRIPGHQRTVKPEYDYEFAPRVYAGFAACSGWGGQISYWRMETTGDNRTSVQQIASDLDLRTADVDVTRTAQLGQWSVQVGAGGRWGQVENNYFGVNNSALNLRTVFEGAGPTALLNLRRPLGSGSWAVVGQGRASFLYGETDVDSTVAPNLEIGDEWMDIWEGRVGFEWTGNSPDHCALFYVRALFEAQYWNVPDVGQLGSPNLNFLGPTISVGFVF